MTLRKTALALVLAAFFISSFAGCSARQVIRDRDYGVVAIPANTNSWPFKYRDKASELMTAHFPDGYEVVREEEVVTGQSTHVNTHRDEHEHEVINDFLTVGHSDTNTTVSTSDQTEYRITYRSHGSDVTVGRAEARSGEFPMDGYSR